MNSMNTSHRAVLMLVLAAVYLSGCTSATNTTISNSPPAIPSLDFSKGAVKRGKQTVWQMGCTACHSTDGSKLIGTTWLGLCGSQKIMESGLTLTVNDEYLYQSIVEPSAHIVAGYPVGVMPANFNERLVEDQIYDIIDYICSLK